MGRFLSCKDMSAAKHAMEIHNARIRRGEINKSDIKCEQHVVCGCGAEGCVFVSSSKKINITSDAPVFHKPGYMPTRTPKWEML